MENALDGLRTRFCPPTQNFGQILVCTPPPPQLNGKWGVPKGGGGMGKRRISHGILVLMRFIDHSNGLRQALGTQVFKKTCTHLMVCDVPLLTSSPSLRISQISTLIPISRVVMNIINGIARGGSPCALVPPSLAPEE